MSSCRTSAASWNPRERTSRETVAFDVPDSAASSADVPTSRRVVDPVVQSLTLTDLVVAVAVSALLLALALKVYDQHRSLDPGEVTELAG